MSRFPRAEWLVCHHPAASATLNLACFAHAGAGASTYRRWGQQVPEDIQVLAVQLPGRENRLREPAVPRIDDLADAVAEVLRPLAEQRPTALYGHSMGALLAYAVATRLQQDAAPFHLLVSGHDAPHVAPTHPAPAAWDDDTLMTELRRLNGTAGPLLDHAEFVRMFLPIFRVDYQACAAYRPEPGPKLRCPITAFIGAQDPDTRPEGVRAWGELTADSFEMFLLPGDHFFPISQEELILRMIAARLMGR